jgi:hypothetical protein
MKNFIFFLLFFVPVFGFAQNRVIAKGEILGIWKEEGVYNGIRYRATYFFRADNGFTGIEDDERCEGEYKFNNNTIRVSYTDENGYSGGYLLEIENIIGDKMIGVRYLLIDKSDKGERFVFKRP